MRMQTENVRFTVRQYLKTANDDELVTFLRRHDLSHVYTTHSPLST